MFEQTKTNKKILWVAHDGNLSGANICLLEYIKILKDHGFEQILVIPFYGAMEQRATKENISVHIIPFYLWSESLNQKGSFFLLRLRKWFRNQLAIRQLKFLINKIKPEYTATNTSTVSVGAFAAKQFRVKHCWFIHEFGEEDHGFSIARNSLKGYQSINQTSYKVIFNSEAVQKKYAPFVSESKRYIVYNAVDVIVPRVADDIPLKPFKLIMLGQIATAKNQIEALKALKICADKGLDFHLDIVGSTLNEEYLQQLKNYLNSEQLSNYVSFREFNSNPIKLLSKHHCLLMCSKMEAFGRVTVEALKCGVPVIASNTGGSVEIVEDGVNGYLYQSGNTYNLADSIMQLQLNYFAFSRSEIAKAALNKYNIANTGMQLLKVFN